MDNRLFINNSLNINSATLRLRNNINVSRKLILRSPSIYIEPPPLESVQVTTLNVTNIEGYTAIGGGNVISGGSTVMRGICWSTSSNPTISDSSLQYPTYGEGVYYLTMSGLNSSTNYYVRAWAYNEDSFDYGDNVQFYTPEVYTACTTYQPFFPNIYEETGFLNCDDVSLTSGTLGEYVIDWRNGSTNGEIVFVTGSSFAADPSVQQIHPIENEIVFGGLLYPVIKSIYIDSIKYSSYNMAGARYSPDLRECLDPINVQPVDCDTSLNWNYVYPVNYSYENLYDAATLKSRTINYQLCTSAGEHIEYLAWSFDAELIPEQLKIYYCTSTNSVGFLVDNFIHGYSTYGVTTNLYPANYPDGSARTYNRGYTGTGERSLRFVTNLTDISFNEGDYLRIEVVGSVYQPELQSTNWSLGIKSLYASDIDCSFYDASIGQIDYSVDPSIVWNLAYCRYEIQYKAVKPVSLAAWADTMKYNAYYSYFPWIMKYTMIGVIRDTYAITAVDSSRAIYLRKSTDVVSTTIYSQTSTCTSCADNGNVTYNIENLNDISTYSMQFTSSTDYNACKTHVTNMMAVASYNTIRNSPDSSIQYYGEFRLKIYNSSTCGDDQTDYDVYIWFGNDPSWNDSTQTIYLPAEVPTISSYIVDMSSLTCNNTYSSVVTAINRYTYCAQGKPYTGGGVPYPYPLTRTIRASSPIYAGYQYAVVYDQTTIESFLGWGINDALLNGVCDLSTKGFIYDISSNNSNLYNNWALLACWDKATITDTNNPINNWKLERRRLLTTLNREDIQWDLVWEVSLGQVIYP